MLYVESAGNVGIGTTSPSALFSVAGKAYFTGNVGVGTSSPAAPFSAVAPNVANGPTVLLTNSAVGYKPNILFSGGRSLWRIGYDQNLSNQFAIGDADGGVNPFVIEDAAPASSFIIKSTVNGGDKMCQIAV